MKSENDDILKNILDNISNIHAIDSGDIPSIDLYMDQVTTFMDAQLADSRRRPEDKILTKTMINNYAKNDLLPPPYRKKYSKDHILLLIFIYYFKNVLTIKDIRNLLKPLSTAYFGKPSEDISIEKVYNTIFHFEDDEIQNLREDIEKKFSTAADTVEDSGDNKDFMQMFTFICMLSYDVYVRKQIIESLLDSMAGEMEPHEEKTKSSHTKQ